MKVTEIYINKESIKEYQLHESLGNGYSILLDIAKESINNAIDTYNKILEENVGKTEEDLGLNINDFIIDEENGLIVETESEFDLSINVNEEDIVPFVDFFVYDGKIIFKDELEIGSIIKIRDEVPKTKIITKNSYNRNALFHVFSSEQKLKFNNDYSFRVSTEEKDFNVSFETQFSPYYCNVKKIREDMGSMINGVTDKQIARLIFGHSKEVYYTLTNQGTESDLTDIEKELYPQKVVRYKTDIDLCWLLYYAASGKYGTISKQIGTIEIEKNTKLPYIETMLKRFEDELKELEDQLNDGTGTVLSFTKGGDTEYTVSNRGVF